MFPTLRKPMVMAVVALFAGVAALAWFTDVRWAAYLLSLGLVVAAVARGTLAEKHVLNARDRRFDILVLLVLAVSIALLAPWGLALSPS